jgi:hypothetical protein
MRAFSGAEKLAFSGMPRNDSHPRGCHAITK